MQTKVIHTENEDNLLEKYKESLRKSVLLELLHEQQATNASPAIAGTTPVSADLDVLLEFDRFAIECGQAPDAMTEYYRTTKWMLQQWGAFPIEETVVRLHAHNYSSRTYNHRRTCLSKYYDWLVRKGKLARNPLAEVKNKRKEKSPCSRSPFTDKEAFAILDALRTERFRKPSSHYGHERYYYFVAFLLHTGARNGEAIGLRITDVNFESFEIKIEHSFSRTLKGTNVSARVLKSTKNDNIRLLPMDTHLYNLLEPLCKNRNPEAFVFLNDNGNPIDDKMFQRRVWKSVLTGLEIPKRDLYACRHTFATRAVRQGLRPHEVAYLMGDSVETILRTYFHNNLRPNILPTPISIRA